MRYIVYVKFRDNNYLGKVIQTVNLKTYIFICNIMLQCCVATKQIFPIIGQSSEPKTGLE